VNVEADVLVKLAYEQMLNNPGLKIETWGTHKPELELTESWLVANGY
jgi:hypothetical protein